MNTPISKKEIIIGLHKNGKSLNEIQTPLMIMFVNKTYKKRYCNARRRARHVIRHGS
jgi:hypothetical protein